MPLSIWLVPPPGASEPLQTVITTLSKNESSPDFQPHITLLSLPPNNDINPEEVLPATEDLPTSIPIKFTGVATGKTYFQSVLIEVDLEQDGPLEKLYEQVFAWNEHHFNDMKEFSATSEDVTPAVNPSTRPYYPHISLFYGDPPMEEKQRIADSLLHEAITVKGTEGASVAGVTGFKVTEIWVALTEGPTSTWKVVRKVKLGE